MPSYEPHTTAWLLVVLGALLGISVLLSRASARFRIPVFLLFLAIGMLAGSEGPGGIEFEDYGFSFRLGTVALVLILFDGGLNTPWPALRRGLGPAAALATAGVAGTAALVGAGARLLGFSWTEALLLGAIVSSTDAAAVFSVLRGSGLRLKPRVGTTLEIESGLNDPMAVILTMALTRSLADGQPPGPGILAAILLQLLIGGAIGAGVGFAGRFLLRRSRLPATGLYPVLTLALAFLAFGLPTLLEGSGFLAVYLAAVVLGNGEVPYRSGLVRFHDAAAWCGQVTMFLVLGLLVFPSRLLAAAGPGLALGLLLALLARPLAALVCLLPFRFRLREIFFVGWVGLRGAVPIILATYPVLERVSGAERLFDVVFFMVVVSALVPGGTVAWATQRLGLSSGEPPPPKAVLEIASPYLLEGDVLSFHVDPALPVAGVALADIPFPPEAAVMLIVRGSELVAPRGDVVLQPGDHVHLFCRREDRGLIGLLFGRPEE
ncbi:MAG TPA: potassium/proton antiporter [Thermoanaerobaculia bacterium]|jgi:cell volume regulation protein A